YSYSQHTLPLVFSSSLSPPPLPSTLFPYTTLFRSALTNPMMNLFLNVGLTLVIVVGAFRVNAGVSSAGNIIAFLSYFTIILNAMMAVTRIFVMCSKGIASGSRIQEVLETPEDLHVTP